MLVRPAFCSARACTDRSALQPERCSMVSMPSLGAATLLQIILLALAPLEDCPVNRIGNAPGWRRLNETAAIE